ncbi:hypothetical protein NOR53_3064 [gamma proteobacterium NOR5-3]|nr:hypothetical protein NOR53_3064 [gamma proteobacterium NOR5-3]
MQLSIVTTLYNSAAYIDEFYRQIISQAETLCADFELIFVDDGSPDDSLAVAVALTQHDGRVKVIELSRNHGHHRAMMIGLEHACGDLVFLIDVDLEEKPKNLSLFWKRLHQQDTIDVVYGTQPEKKTPFFRKTLSKSFYTVFNGLSPIKISDRALVSRLMTRNYVQSLLQYREREIFLPALWEDAGYRQVSVEVDKEFNGNSSYTLTKRIKLSIDAITSFSSTPLSLIFYLGTGMSSIAGLVVIYLAFRHFFLDQSATGWASTIASIYLTGGLIIFSLGIIGVYLSRIFLEVKQRPYSIVRKIHGSLKDE